jgi:hypothetical protein
MFIPVKQILSPPTRMLLSALPKLSIEVAASVKTSSKIRQLLVVDIESKPTGY